jgi:hypothetical protein
VSASFGQVQKRTRRLNHRQSEGESQPGRLVVQIELGITPPSTGMERLSKAAMDAVQRVYENGGTELHFIGYRVIDR